MPPTGQTFGIVLGLGVAGAIFQTKSLQYVSPLLSSNLPPSEVSAAIAGTSSAIFNKLPSFTRALVIQAITRAIDQVYVLVIATGALILILALLLPVSLLLFLSVYTFSMRIFEIDEPEKLNSLLLFFLEK